jgi:hypothetical protein
MRQQTEVPAHLLEEQGILPRKLFFQPVLSRKRDIARRTRSDCNKGIGNKHYVAGVIQFAVILRITFAHIAQVHFGSLRLLNFRRVGLQILRSVDCSQLGLRAKAVASRS